MPLRPVNGQWWQSRSSGLGRGHGHFPRWGKALCFYILYNDTFCAAFCQSKPGILTKRGGDTCAKTKSRAVYPGGRGGGAAAHRHPGGVGRVPAACHAGVRVFPRAGHAQLCHSGGRIWHRLRHWAVLCRISTARAMRPCGVPRCWAAAAWGQRWCRRAMRRCSFWCTASRRG